jgi:hypothetical protein
MTQWHDDPLHPGRQIGLVSTPSGNDYVQPVIRIAVRCRKNNGQWAIGVLITNLTPDEVVALGELEGDILADFSQLWLAYVLGNKRSGYSRLFLTFVELHARFSIESRRN